MIDDQLRKEAVAVFTRLGLSEDEAITLFYKRTVAAGRMPFASAQATDAKQQPKKKRMNERFAEWDAF